MRVFAVVLGCIAVALAAPLRSNRQLENAEVTEALGLSATPLVADGVKDSRLFFEKHVYPKDPSKPISKSDASAVTADTVCGSVYRLDGGSVSTKFVIPGEMANVEFEKKGTQKCGPRQENMRIFVSTSKYNSMKCSKGSNGWAPAWSSFKSNYICICASGQSPNIGYHLAGYEECNALRA